MAGDIGAEGAAPQQNFQKIGHFMPNYYFIYHMKSENIVQKVNAYIILKILFHSHKLIFSQQVFLYVYQKTHIAYSKVQCQ